MSQAAAEEHAYNPFSENTASGSKYGWDERSLFDGRSVNAGTTAAAKTLEPVEEKNAAWKHIFKAMEVHDERQVESWKSEMDNLLIFATLYSAIVTAFLIESFKLVAPDSSDGTLMDISTRLVSFKLSNGFANATHMSEAATKDTSPAPVAVRINTVWFVSLTLSIIAAFFAIAIQQWLRHILVPKHIPLRDAIRLRQLRYQGLMKWQVPVIITILPALVQISVVLFLVGLLQYVRHYSKDVALPFTVISSISLVLFVIVSFIPLLDASCPYKSPLVHILWELTWVAGIMSTLVVVIPVVSILDCATPRKHARFSSLANKIDSLHKRYANKLKPSTTEASRFWTARESAVAMKDKSKELDRRALAWALTAGPPVSKLACCLQDLAPGDRTRCVLEWISVKFHGQADISYLLDGSTISKETFDLIDNSPTFVSEYAYLLLTVLSKGGDDAVRGKDEDIPHILTILYHLADKGAEISLRPGEDPMKLRVILINEIKTLCLAWHDKDLKDAQAWQGWKPAFRIPAVLLFALIDIDHIDRSAYLQGANAEQYLSKAIELVKGIEEAQQRDTATKSWLAPLEHVSTLSALALRVVVENPSQLDLEAVRTALSELMTVLSALVDKAEYKKKIKKQATSDNRIRKTVSSKFETLERDSSTLPFVTPDAINSVCHSLEQLGNVKEGPRTQGWMAVAQDFARRLLPVCENESNVREGKESLQAFLGLRLEKSAIRVHERSQTMMSMSAMSGVEVIDTIPSLPLNGSGSSKEHDDASK